MTKEALHRAFRYDAVSGILFCRELTADPLMAPSSVKRWNTTRANKPVGGRLMTTRGTPSKIQVSYAGKSRAAHRIIWTMVHGYIPENAFIDHINGNPFDNRISNLRLSNHNTNQYNRGAPKVNTSGFKGVTWSKALSKWKATVRANAKYHHLGYYNTKSEAAVAVAKGSIRYHGAHSVYLRDFKPGEQRLMPPQAVSVNDPVNITSE